MRSVVHLLKMIAHDTSEKANKIRRTTIETGPESRTMSKGFNGDDVSIAVELMSCKS